MIDDQFERLELELNSILMFCKLAADAGNSNVAVKFWLNVLAAINVLCHTGIQFRSFSPVS